MRLFNSIPPDIEEPFEAEAFVRRARHLRATLSDRPAELHQALRQPVAGRAAAVRSPGELFADAVYEGLEGGILRYSARGALLRRAAQLGIDRFEANLIIAAVQHRATDSRGLGAHARPRQRRSGEGRSIPARNMLIVAAVQLAIIGLAWWLYSL